MSFKKKVTNVWASFDGASGRNRNAAVLRCDNVIMAEVVWNRLFCDTAQSCGRQPCTDESAKAPAEETWPWIQSIGFHNGLKTVCWMGCSPVTAKWIFSSFAIPSFFLSLCGGPWKIYNTLKGKRLRSSGLNDELCRDVHLYEPGGATTCCHTWSVDPPPGKTVLWTSTSSSLDKPSSW